MFHRLGQISIFLELFCGLRADKNKSWKLGVSRTPGLILDS